MDGVIWLGDEVIAGSADAVARLKADGHRVVYVTNNSALTASGYVQKLKSCGIEAVDDDIIHGGNAVAALVEPGSTVLICAGAGVVEAVRARGASIVLPEDVDGFDVPPVEAVIIGWRPDYDSRLMSLAVRAVLAGARLLAPSSDPLYPSSDGVLIGGGSLTAAISYATKTEATFAGKPYQPIVDALIARVGAVDIVVGDQPATDGVLAQRMGVDFALVLTGVAGHNSAPDVPIALTADDLAAVVEARLGTL